jgi:hypothetical protein
MRGRHANPQFRHWRSPDEPALTTISPEAISIYRKMRRLEWRCECPGEEEFEHLSDWMAHQCANCAEWWRLNAKLARCFKLFEGMVVYEDPAWKSTKFQQSAVDRFFALERAAKRTKARKFKYKWEV